MSLTMDDYVVGLSVGSLNRSNHLLLRAGSNGTPTTSTIHTSTSNSALKKTAERYLSTTAMRATENSMALVSSVLGFEIVEIWTESEPGKLHCTYVHAEESVTEKYPDIICGHFPEHKKEHILSPKLCELAKASSNRCHWRIIENRVYSPSTAGTVYDQLKFPLRTEMAYQLEHENNKSSPLAFIVALSFEKIQYKPYKLKFLSGLAVAIFVAAFDLEEEDKQVERRMSIQNEQELDNKEFLPVHSHSSVNLAAMANAPTTVSVMGNVTKNHSSVSVPALNLSALTLGLNASVGSLVPTLDFSKLTDISTRKPTLTGADVMVNARRSRTNTANSDSISAMMNMKGNASSPGLLVPALALPEMYPLNDTGANRAKANSGGSQHSIGLDLSQSDGKLSPATSARAMVSPRALELPPLEPALTVATPRDVLDDVLPTPRSMISVASRPDLTSTNAVVPAWEPATSFSYPIFQIPIKHSLQNDLTMESFSDVKHIADGSNSNIFLAKFNGVRAIIKMIKQQAENDSIAIQEFDLEYGTLARLAHPHIIRILGAGNLPRRFIVLEWLGGGTLQTVLAENQQSVGLAQKFFRKPTFTYTSLLQNAKHIAEALEYLHHRCHPGATIIHRDLKPDNVGYTKDGQLKLFDFGLVTCVKARQKSDEAYEMTGYTGSLRYMAPEVVLRKPYSEKADVYSFAIMLWQMASDKVPFKGFSKEEFIDQVVYQGLRPKLDKSWPTALNTLLKRCWEEDPVARPSFTIIVLELNKLLAQENQHGSNPLKSSWF